MTGSDIESLERCPRHAPLRLIDSLSAGLKPIELQYYDDVAASLLALLAGRADAIFNPNGLLAYESVKHGRIHAVGTVNAGWPPQSDVGITTRKDSSLAPALTQAINDLIEGRQYADVLSPQKR